MGEELSGIRPPARDELPFAGDRISFLYLDGYRLERDDGAIKAVNDAGFVNIPAAGVTVLMLGPGTTVTHRAIQCASESGLSICADGRVSRPSGSHFPATQGRVLRPKVHHLDLSITTV